MVGVTRLHVLRVGDRLCSPNVFDLRKKVNRSHKNHRPALEVRSNMVMLEDMTLIFE